MKSRMGWRARLGALGTILALSITGLVLSGPPARAVIEQHGPRNYAGPPGTCPSDANPCDEISGDVEVIQDQTNPDDGGGRYNKAVCDQNHTSNAADANAAPVAQSCSVTQDAGATGASNTVNVAISSDWSVDEEVGGSRKQTVDQRLKISQKSVNGDNTVAGYDTATKQPTDDARLTLNESVKQDLGQDVLTGTPVVDETPIEHTQRSFQFASIRQEATGTGDNAATLTLRRTQSSFTRGLVPSQKQDDEITGSIAESICPASAGARNGNTCIVQQSKTGTNAAKIRALDKKTIDAQNVPTGNSVTQQQGPADVQGGWYTDVDQESTDNPGGSTLDLGEICSPDDKTDCSADPPKGVGKWWTMMASNLTGGPVGGSSTQNDGILDNISLPGRTTCDGTAQSWTLLEGRAAAGSDAGTVQHANLDTVGHTKTLDIPCSSGQPAGLKGSISAHFKKLTPELQGIPPTVTPTLVNEFGKRINFNSTTVSAHIGCTDFGDGSTSCARTDNVQGSPTTINAVRAVPFTDQPAAEFTANGNANEYAATIDWGDGTTSPSDAVKIDGSNGNYSVLGSHTYSTAGTKDLKVTITKPSDPAVSAVVFSKAIVAEVGCPTGGCFVIGDRVAGPNVTLWGSQWSAANLTTFGNKSSSFKGWENDPKVTAQSCGGSPPPTWETRTGNSPPPPSASEIPDVMPVLVTDVVNGGKHPSGTIVKVVIVQVTNKSTYNASPSGVLTGTIIGQRCPA